jgi:hypothetical protein
MEITKYTSQKKKKKKKKRGEKYQEEIKLMVIAL